MPLASAPTLCATCASSQLAIPQIFHARNYAKRIHCDGRAHLSTFGSFRLTFPNTKVLKWARCLCDRKGMEETPIEPHLLAILPLVHPLSANTHARLDERLEEVFMRHTQIGASIARVCTGLACIVCITTLLSTRKHVDLVTYPRRHWVRPARDVA